jgi:ribosomal protein S18 acetylase RimI-like enzyme
MPNFRLAGESDATTILGFMRELYAMDGTRPLEEEKARRALLGIVGDPMFGRVWVIQDGAEAIGYVILTLGYSLEYGGRDGFIDELFIDEAHRGRGVGRETMRFVEDACRELRVRALHLEVERANTAAQRLYRKFGFADHDRYLLTKWIES